MWEIMNSGVNTSQKMCYIFNKSQNYHTQHKIHLSNILLIRLGVSPFEKDK